MKRQDSNSYNKKESGLRWFFYSVAILFGIIALAFLIQKFRESYFEYGTTIQGVDCSFLTAEEATKRVEREINEKTVTIQLIDNQYTVNYETFGFQITATDEVEEILATEHRNNSKEHFLTDSVTIDEQKLREWLESIPDLKAENMEISQNAYIQWDGADFSIVPEVLGNLYNFEEIYQILANDLSSGMPENIDLQGLAYGYPEITSEQLQSKINELESILSTTIHYQLTDGTEFTLDRDVMKQWVIQDKDGNYQIDIVSNLPSFVEQLNNMVENADQELSFHPTGLENVVNVPIVDTPPSSSINQEEEIARITDVLGSGKTYQYTPIYNENSTLNTLNSYIEIDITRQHVWMYVDGVCIVDTDTVTGNITVSGYATPTGVYFLDSKTTNTTLRGYNKDGSRYASWVQFWMPFYGGYGLHDATWRDSFGGTIYQTNGSHGCVNLPYEMAEIIYQNLDYNTPIIIYES